MHRLGPYARLVCFLYQHAAFLFFRFFFLFQSESLRFISQREEHALDNCDEERQSSSFSKVDQEVDRQLYVSSCLPVGHEGQRAVHVSSSFSSSVVWLCALCSCCKKLMKRGSVGVCLFTSTCEPSSGSAAQQPKRISTSGLRISLAGQIFFISPHLFYHIHTHRSSSSRFISSITYIRL